MCEWYMHVCGVFVSGGSSECLYMCVLYMCLCGIYGCMACICVVCVCMYE